MVRSALTAKLKVVIPTSSPLAAAIEGKATAVLSAAIKLSNHNALSASITGEWLGDPIDLLAFLNVRTSGEFLNPEAQQPLSLVYGNWTEEKGVSCTNIDTSNNVWHLADHALGSIGSVFVDGSLYTSGAIINPSYIDTTGKTIAVIILPIKATTVSAHCTGKLDKYGDLIERPTSIIIDILTKVMGFNPYFVDTGVMSKSDTYFSKNDVALRYVFKTQNTTVKSVVENIAADSRSLYLNKKGLHSIKPRSVAW